MFSEYVSEMKTDCSGYEASPVIGNRKFVFELCSSLNYGSSKREENENPS
jgi:hypothetical protein